MGKSFNKRGCPTVSSSNCEGGSLARRAWQTDSWGNGSRGESGRSEGEEE